MNNKWILPSLVALAVSNAALAAPSTYLYKDNRVMGMGGASVATGGYTTALFSNPAGLDSLPRDHGMIVEVLGLNFTTSQNSISAVGDILDAADTGSEDAVSKVLDEYAGEPVHIALSNYSAIGYNHGDIAWSAGLLAASEVNLTANPSNFNVLDVQSRAYGGLNAGMSYTFHDLWLGDLSLGLGGKFYAQNSYEDTLDPDDIIDFETTGDSISDRASETRTAFAFDLGAIYRFDVPLNPSFGISVLNIGELDFDDAYGSQPMSVNIGGAVEPNVPFFKRTRIAVDYVDVLNENTYRLYRHDDNTDGSPTFTDAESFDAIQNLRLGASALVYDNSWSALELAAGLYQGNITAGIDFAASIFKLSFATYGEEIGPKAGDKTDRRYNLNIGIGW